MLAKSVFRSSASLPLVLLSACSSMSMEDVWPVYESGDYVQSKELIEQLADENRSDDHLYALERSLVEFALEDPASALQALRYGRDRLDELTGDDFAGWFGSVLLDDRQLDYAGAPYEHVLVRAMLALADLMNNGIDARAFALQVRLKQIEIMESLEDEEGEPIPQNAYRLVAFGSYLAGILSEEDYDLDQARQAFERVVELEPNFVYGQRDLERVQSGVPSQKGNGVVHILALVGRGPYRVETQEPVTQAALAIAQAIWQIYRDRVVFPNIASVPIPALAFQPGNPTETHVYVDGRHRGVTATVTDVEATAQEEFDSIKKFIVARAVVRRVFKIVVTEGAKELVNPQDENEYERKTSDTLIDVGISALGLLWTALEEADLRCWSLLPAKFQVLRLELPEGEYDITVRAGLNGTAIGQDQTVRVFVRDGYNTYVVPVVPTTAGGPPPLTSERGLAEPEASSRQ